MSRRKPYETKPETWKSILQHKYYIPMNQRQYSWDENNISEYLDDLFEIFTEGKYYYRMGSIIYLEYKGDNYIYDGQQRVLTTVILLNAIASLCDSLTSTIKNDLSINVYIDQLTEEQNEKKEKFEAEFLPKIWCVNPFDTEALINILNSSFSDFEKYNTESKLGKAYIKIYSYINNLNLSLEDFKSLYKFIMNEIDIQTYKCSDSIYVSKIFTWENNRGKQVEELDIIKNPILVTMPEDKKIEVYNKWEELKKITNKIYKKNYGQRLFDVAIQIYNGEIKRKIDRDKLFKSIIDADDSYKELNKFFDIVEKLDSIMLEISNDKFGRLVTSKSNVCLNWEAYMWCFFPIFYTIGEIDNELIKLTTQWYFRQIGMPCKLRGFNNLCYSNVFISVSNKVLNNPEYDYFSDIKTTLKNNMDNSVISENYINSLKKIFFNTNFATYLLLFLETCINTDIHCVSLDYSLEHICAQKNKADMEKPSLINNIGNLTLIEKKNSKNGHKGNSSLGCKPYNDKRPHYSESSSKVTRLIASNYTDFNESSIIERCEEIGRTLDEQTTYW